MFPQSSYSLSSSSSVTYVVALKTVELRDHYYSCLCEHCQCGITQSYALGIRDLHVPVDRRDAGQEYEMNYSQRFDHHWHIYHASCIATLNQFAPARKKITEGMVHFKERLSEADRADLTRILSSPR